VLAQPREAADDAACEPLHAPLDGGADELPQLYYPTC
jgi:hypothetical protein